MCLILLTVTERNKIASLGHYKVALDQISMFPTAGLHDDLVDALSYVDQLAVTSYNQDYEDDEYEIMDTIAGY